MKTRDLVVSSLTFLAVLFLMSAVIGAPPPAQAQTVQVLSADPPSAAQGTVNLNVLIKGKGFKNGAIAKFLVTGTNDPGGVKVNSTTFVSSTSVTANIDVADTAVLSKFDIQVMNSDGRGGKGTELFSVTAKGTADSQQVVPLRAAFCNRNADNILSDGKGPYESGGSLDVHLDVDGDLVFSLQSAKSRTVFLRFPDLDRLRAGDGREMPPNPVLEPLSGMFFLTMTGTAQPYELDFRHMKPYPQEGGQGIVTMHITFSTVVRSGFWLRFQRTFADTGNGGDVFVTALDKDSDGEVDRWVIEPLDSASLNEAYLRRNYSKGRERVVVDLGDYKMPFRLVLDRVDRPLPAMDSCSVQY